MLKFSGFHFVKPVIISLFSLGMLLITDNSFAQSENEKVEDNIPKSTDRIILEDQTVVQDNFSQKPLPNKPIVSQKSSISPLKRDTTYGDSISEKETKKNESPSTLSFNIFLYIVDKFKAD